MKEFFHLYKSKIILGSGVVIILSILLWPRLPSNPEPPFYFHDEINAEEERSEINNSEVIEADNTGSTIILIDIKGAVDTPGVYEMTAGERVIDAVERAGGFLEDADTRKVNLAELLMDEMVIIVPKEGEEVEETIIANERNNPNQSDGSKGKININTATEEELTRLSGVGPAKAKAIISYRAEHGLFKSIDEIVQVSGFGEKTLEKIRDDIAISN